MKKPYESCVILLSGGQDSTTCLYIAKKTFKNVFALGFDYGQKHKIELKQAKKIAKDAEVQFDVINIKGLLDNSALVNHTVDIDDKHRSNQHLPASWTPARNALFLNIAMTFAFNQGISDVMVGVCQTDYSGYPDCRRVFIDSMQTSMSLALACDMRIHTPLMYLNKAHTWKIAKELGVIDIIINDTITDYNGSKKKNDWGYGKEDNEASRLRKKGYEEAKKKGWI